MKFRSMLIVPGDRPDEMALALEAGADALILDLSDVAGPIAKAEARRSVAEFLGRNPGRSLWVFGAAAAGVAAIESAFHGNGEGLQFFAERARRDGFSGMLAANPDQVPVINQAFS